MKHKTLLFIFAALALCLTACDKAPTMTTEKAAATPAPARAVTVEQEIKKLEEEWIEAEIKKDRAWYERHLADELVSTGSLGGVQGKSEYIREEMLTTHTTSAGSATELKVRVYGDAAVANYIFTQSGNRQTGPYTNRQSRYTDVWVRRSGAWQVVATHGSNITPPLSPATTSAAAAWAKASTAQPTEKDAQELVRYEIEWGSLIGEKGLAFMERIEADDYLYTDGAGRLYTKAQDIAAAREREGSGNTREMRDIKVSFYGDVAVLTALFHDKVKDKGGAKDGYVRGTDVWLKRNGAWQCVAAHGSDLPTSSTNKPANKP